METSNQLARRSRQHPEVVVITGASAGVGRATARLFAAQGARLGLIARGKEGLEGAQREVQELGGQALILPADVADESQVEEAATTVENTFGQISTWINCAMTSVFSPVREMEGREFKRVMEVNYLGYVYGTLAALKRMLPRNAGTILQVSSALGFRSTPLQSAHCASKRAIIGFTEALRTELLHDETDVRVTMVHMPALNTPQFTWVKSRLPKQAQPVPPIFQPEVAAQAILWAAHHPRRDLAVGRSTLKTILGEKISPNLLDHYQANRGYQSQMTDTPREPDHPNNLWHPVPGDHGAHGPFDEQASSSSPALFLAEHRGLILGVALAALGLGALARQAVLARGARLQTAA